MTAPTPWSIKGIDAEARQAAKDAARREGMTLGAWITKRVIEMSASDAAAAVAHAPRPLDGDDDDAFPASFPPSTPRPLEDGPQLAALEARLDARIDSKLEAMTAQIATFGESADRVASAVETNGVRVEIAERAAELVAEAIDRRLAAFTPPTSPEGDGAADRNGAALEPGALGALLAQALGPIATRLDALSEGVAATSNASEHALEDLTERVEGAARRHEEMSTAVGGAVAALAERLADVEAALTEATRAIAVANASVGPQLSTSTLDTFAGVRRPPTPSVRSSHKAPDPLSTAKPAALPETASAVSAATKKPAGAPNLNELRARLHGGSEERQSTEEEDSLKESLSTVRDLLPDAASPLTSIDEEVSLDAQFDAAQSSSGDASAPGADAAGASDAGFDFADRAQPPAPPPISTVDDQSGWEEIERQTGLKPVTPLPEDVASTALDVPRTEPPASSDPNPGTLTDRLGKLAGRLLGGGAKGGETDSEDASRPRVAEQTGTPTTAS